MPIMKVDVTRRHDGAWTSRLYVFTAHYILNLETMQFEVRRAWKPQSTTLDSHPHFYNDQITARIAKRHGNTANIQPGQTKAFYFCAGY